MKKENHSGEGIYFSSRLIDIFMAVSGKKIFTHDNHIDTVDNIDEESILGKAIKDKGTIVYMKLANNSHKELREVFDMYADIDNGFNKTSVPVKNIFGNEFPVSRSQA